MSVDFAVAPMLKASMPRSEVAGIERGGDDGGGGGGGGFKKAKLSSKKTILNFIIIISRVHL